MHLSENTIGLYAVEPSLVSLASVAHLESCPKCQRVLGDIRAFEDALRDPETWAGVAVSLPEERNDGLSKFAARFAEEDAAALVLLDPFKEPSAAARFVYANVAAMPDFQTGGVARLLCQMANGMCERDPLYALKLAEAATAISEVLPDTAYPRRTIHELRGEALKEQANALLFLGRFPEAMRAVEGAEGEYAQLPHEGIGMVAVKYVRGCVLFGQGEFDAAQEVLLESASDALSLGSVDRYRRARHMLGYVRYQCHDYARAASVFGELLHDVEAEGDKHWIARESLALGVCCVMIRDISGANRYLHTALRLFSELDLTSEVIRTRLTIARLLFVEGNTNEAVNRVRRCIREFGELHMVTDVALAAVDLAEILNASDRDREIPKVLENVVQTFIDAGKLTGALTALAYLKDAATRGTVTSHLVDYVRRFVERADRQPDLLFAPPPPEAV